jgi:hypothetical protein
MWQSDSLKDRAIPLGGAQFNSFAFRTNWKEPIKAVMPLLPANTSFGDISLALCGLGMTS